MIAPKRRWSGVIGGETGPTNLTETDAARDPLGASIKGWFDGAVAGTPQQPNDSWDGQCSRRQRHGAASGFPSLAPAGRHITLAISRDAGRRITVATNPDAYLEWLERHKLASIMYDWRRQGYPAVPVGISSAWPW